MASRKPARDRSRHITEALTRQLTKHDEQLLRACDVANADPDVTALEYEMDLLPCETAEPWG